MFSWDRVTSLRKKQIKTIWFYCERKSKKLSSCKSPDCNIELWWPSNMLMELFIPAQGSEVPCHEKKRNILHVGSQQANAVTVKIAECTILIIAVSMRLTTMGVNFVIKFRRSYQNLISSSCIRKRSIVRLAFLFPGQTLSAGFLNDWSYKLYNCYHDIKDDEISPFPFFQKVDSKQ